MKKKQKNGVFGIFISRIEKEKQNKIKTLWSEEICFSSSANIASYTPPARSWVMGAPIVGPDLPTAEAAYIYHFWTNFSMWELEKCPTVNKTITLLQLFIDNI